MTPAGFEPAIPASEQSQTDALDRVDNEIGRLYSLPFQKILCVCLNHEVSLVVASTTVRFPHVTCGRSEGVLSVTVRFSCFASLQIDVVRTMHVYTRYRWSEGVREHVNTGDLHCVTLHTLLPPLLLWARPLCVYPLPTI